MREEEAYFTTRALGALFVFPGHLLALGGFFLTYEKRPRPEIFHSLAAICKSC